MIQTARCVLRPLQPNDLELVVALYTSEEVRRFLGGPVSEEVARSSFSALLKSSEYYWVVRTKDNSAIGTVSLGTHHDGMDTEVSYQVLPQWWGRGYAAEVMEAILAYARLELKLPRVVAETQSANAASRRLLERLGMRLEGTVERFGSEQAIYVTDTL